VEKIVGKAGNKVLDKADLHRDVTQLDTHALLDISSFCTWLSYGANLASKNQRKIMKKFMFASFDTLKVYRLSTY
jgi:hypothetical protein